MTRYAKPACVPFGCSLDGVITLLVRFIASVQVVFGAFERVRVNLKMIDCDTLVKGRFRYFTVTGAPNFHQILRYLHFYIGIVCAS